MKVYELILLLSGRPAESEVRIGDAFEDGPYSHMPVGAVHKSRVGNDIIISGADSDWLHEQDDIPLEILWPKENQN